MVIKQKKSKDFKRWGLFLENFKQVKISFFKNYFSIISSFTFFPFCLLNMLIIGGLFLFFIKFLN